MSNYQDQDLPSTEDSTNNKLHICLFSTQQQLIQSMSELLNRDRYKLQCFDLNQDLVDFIASNKEEIDCIVFVKDSQDSVLKQLQQSKILLPTVIVEVEQLNGTVKDGKQVASQALTDIALTPNSYHSAEIRLYPTQLLEINSYINLAITKFLSLTPNSDIDHPKSENNPPEQEEEDIICNSLVSQQRRLTNKLKERLGYLGVYYKRNTKYFYSNLSDIKQDEFYQQLSNNYRQILLDYFSDNLNTNQLIDRFVDQAFFADVSTSQILEIHMELIDNFAHQLKLEGRNDDILLDYRLPLIDIIAHLCEMYRRSIPGDDISWELLFKAES